MTSFKRGMRILKAAAGFIIVFLLLIVVLIVLITSEPPKISASPENIALNQAIKQQAVDEGYARSWAEIYVKQSLKAPATAKFQDRIDFAVAPARDKKNKILKDVWEVSGYVDAQNSYGAILRNQFYVMLFKMSEDRWVAKKIVVR